MYKPELYEQHNYVQRKNTKLALDTFEHLLQWRPEDNAILLDIGCGTGDVLVDILMPRIPATCQVFGADISDKMVSHCCKKYKAIQNVKFVQMDVLKVDEFLKQHSQVDHVTSFYTLHWIKDHQTAFRNIFRLLKSGGDFFATFLGTAGSFKTNAMMSNEKKWAPYLHLISNFISPYYESRRPDLALNSLMESIGFKEIVIDIWTGSHGAPSVDSFKENMKSVHPEIEKIPLCYLEEYMKDFIAQGLQQKFIQTKKSSGETSMEYELLVVFAKKY